MKKVQQKHPFFIDAIVIWRDMILSNMIVGLRASAPTYVLTYHQYTHETNGEHEAQQFTRQIN